jgi:RHS repeat-associated protein
MKTRHQAVACALIGLLAVTSLPILPGAPIAQVAGASCTGARLVVAWPTTPAANKVDAGTRTTIKVSVTNSSGKTCTSFSGTATVTVSDSAAWYDTVNTAKFSSGVANVVVIPETVGTITATATTTGATAGTSPAASVGATYMAATVPTIQAGATASIPLVAKSAWNNATVTGAYRNPVTVDFGESTADPATWSHTYATAEASSATSTVRYHASGAKTITVTDTRQVPNKATSIAATVAPTTLAWTVPATALAGDTVTAHLEARNSSGTVVTGFDDTVSITSSGSGDTVSPESPYTFTTADAGKKDFSVTIADTGSRTVTATDTKVSALSGTSGPIIASTAAFAMSLTPADSALYAGEQVSLVVAVGSMSSPDPSYRGTVHFTSSDSAAVLPADYTFTAADAGQHTFSVIFGASGQQSVTATDTGASANIGRASGLVAETYLLYDTAPISRPAKVEAVLPVCASGSAASCDGTRTRFVGTLQITSSLTTAVVGPGAAADGTYIFTEADAGRHDFRMSWTATGSPTVTVTDVNQATRKVAATVSITTAPTAATGLRIDSVVLLDYNVPTPANVTVAAMADATGQSCSIVLGATTCPPDRMVGLSTVASASNATTGQILISKLNDGFTLTGVHGAMTITTFQPGPTYTALAAKVLVDGAQVSTIKLGSTRSRSPTLTQTLAGVPTTGTHTVAVVLTANATHTLQVNSAAYVASNAYVFTGYTGTVKSTSTDAGATLPANYTFTGAGAGKDNGRHSLPFVFSAAGSFTATVTDTVTSTLTATTPAIVMTDRHYNVTVTPAGPAAGVPATLKIDVVTNDGTALAYTGDITIAYTDPDVRTVANPPATAPTAYHFDNSSSVSFSLLPETAGAQSISVTDVTNPAITTTTAATVAETNFTISAAGFSTVGVAGTVTVTAVDGSGATVTGFQGRVVFSVPFAATIADCASGCTPVDRATYAYVFKSSDSGMHTFTVRPAAGGSGSIAVSDFSHPARTASSATVTIADVRLVWVTPPATAQAGAPTQVTLKAVDQDGNTVTGYTNKVNFTSTDAAFSESPSDWMQSRVYTFVAGDAGQKTFTIKLNTAGSQTITATDAAVGSRTASFTATVGESHLVWVNAPSTAQAGVPNQTTLKVVDDSGNTVTGYTNQINFTTTASSFSMSPTDWNQSHYYTFVAGDAGQKTFTIKLNTAGSQTFTATDVTTAGRTVSFAANVGESHLVWVNAPSAAQAGVPSQAILKVVDDSGNTVTGYANQINFTTTASAFSISPTDWNQSHYYTFASADAGQKTFTIKLNTAGNRTFTATDVTTAGRTVSFTATVGESHLVWVDPPASALAGTPSQATLKIVDDSGNTVTGYTNRINFTSTDAAFSMSPTDWGQTHYYTFASADAGQKVFTIKFNTAGSQTFTATDVTTAGRTTAFTTAVHSVSFVWSPASAQVPAGQQLQATLKVVDENGDPIPYTGTVNFTSSDAAFSISPTDWMQSAKYTFTAADAGQKLFTLRFAAAGAQTLTATDAAVASRTAILPVTVGQIYLQTVAPASTEAGTLTTVKVKIVDGSGNLVPYTGTIKFTSTDPLVSVSPADWMRTNQYTFVVADGGQRDFSVFMRTSGSQTLTATEAASPGRTVSATMAVAPVHLAITADPIANTGDAMSFTVTALRADNSVATSFGDVVHISSTDSGFQASSVNVTSDYFFTPGDGGSHVFTGRFATAGSQTISATWGGQTVSAPVTAFNPHLELTVPANVQAGVPVTVVLSARDPSGNLVGTYHNTVTATTTDAAASLGGISGYTFTPADGGSHAFTVIFRTPGPQTITVIDSANTNRRVTSSAAVADTVLSVSVPASAQAGAVADVTVSARTTGGELVSGYAETIKLTSTDTLFTGPDCATYTFSPADAGSHVFACRFQSVGSRTVTVTNAGRSAQTATSGAVTVSETYLRLSLDPVAPAAGQQATLTISAVDASDNLVAAFGDSIALTSSDPGFVATPSLVAFSPADGGVKTATVVFSTDLAAWIQAADTSNTARLARVSNKNQPMIVVAVPASAYQGAQTQVEVQILGADGSPDPSFVGPVALTSTDPHISLLAAYVFGAADAGRHVFPVTFNTTGNQTISASGGSRAGTSTAVAVDAVHFVVTPEVATVQAGTQAGIVVEVRDSAGNLVTGYSNPVVLTTSDAAAVVATPTYRFVPSTDNGSHRFQVLFETAGPATVTAADAAAGVTASGSLSVAETHLELTLSSGSTNAGVPITATVRALDASDAVVTGFVGAVTFTGDPGLKVVDPETDTAIALPITFKAEDAGSHVFTIRPATAGSWTVTVADSRMSARSAGQPISVGETSFRLNLTPNANVAGQTQMTVTALDSEGRKLNGYRGLLTITASGGGMQFAGNPQYAELLGATAVNAFGITFTQPGTFTITVADADNPARSASVTQTVGATHYKIVVPPTGYLNAITDVTVLLVDANDQPVPYAAGIKLTATSTDAAVAWKDGAVYSPNGQARTGHTFKAIFGTTGTQTVTVTDGLGHTITSGDISVSRGTFQASVDGTVFKDVPFSLVLKPQTLEGGSLPGYAATVTLSSSDPGADFGVGGASYTFSGCACSQSGKVIKLHQTGWVTITVTGTDATRTVRILVNDGMIFQNPFTTIDAVQMRGGDTVDYYVDSPQAWRIIESYDLNPALFTLPIGGGISMGTASSHPAGISAFSAPSFQEGHIIGGRFVAVAAHALHVEMADGSDYWTLVGLTTRFDGLPAADQAKFASRKISDGDPILSIGTTGYSVVITAAGSGALTSAEWSVGDGDTPEDGKVSLGESFGPGTTELNPGGPRYRQECYYGGTYIAYNYARINYVSSDGRMGFFDYAGTMLPFKTGCPVKKSNAAAGDCSIVGIFCSSPEEFLKEFFGSAGRAIGQALAADPVNTLTGSFQDGESDLSMGGLGPNLTLDRFYESPHQLLQAQSTEPRLFGQGWTSTLDWRITSFPDDPKGLTIRDAQGNHIRFLNGSDPNVFPAAIGFPGKVTKDAAGYEYEDGTGQTYRFDRSSGKLLAIIEPHGRQLSIEYDANGLPTSMADPTGGHITLTNDGTNITRAALGDGRHVDYTYAGGELASVTRVDGSVLRYEYDNQNRMTVVRDGSGKQLVANTYGDDGALIQQEDAAGQLTTFDHYWPDAYYDRALPGTTVTGPGGEKTTNCYSLAGYLQTTINPDGTQQNWTYDSNLTPSSFTDELGRTSYYKLNKDGQLLSQTDPAGRTVNLTWDGRLLAREDLSNGASLVAVNDPINGPSSVTLSKGTNTQVQGTYTYTPLGQMATVAGPDGKVTSFTYDSRGYLASVTDATGAKTTYETDARGLVVKTVDPLGNATGADPEEHAWTKTYDDLGQVLTSTDPLGNTTTYTYDVEGNVKTVTSPLGFLTTNDYDDLGRITSSTQQIDATTTVTTTFVYNASGYLSAVVDGEGRRVEFEYDLVGRRTLVRDEAGKEWHTIYDAVGRVTSETDPTGRTVQYEYNIDDQVVAVTDAGGHRTTYQYNDETELASVTDVLGHSTSYTYDWLSRPTVVTDALSEPTTVTYDAAGNIATITDAAGNTTVFGYDDANRLASVTDASTAETTYGYDPAGQLIRTTNARGYSSTYEHDAAGRQTATVDELGRRSTVHYDADSRTDWSRDAKGQQTAYAYDDLGRLLTVTPASGSPISFTYDKTDRRQTMTDGSGLTSYSYDPVGNVTQTIQQGKTVGYGYDDAGRQTSVTYPDGGGSVSYTYDTEGRPSTITDWSGRTTTYQYDGGDRVATVSGPNSLSESIDYDVLNRPLSVAYSRNSSNLLTLGYTYDAVGNLKTATDDQGQATFGYDELNRLTSASYPASQNYTYTYDAVGNITQQVTPSATTNHTFDAANQIADPGYLYDANGSLTYDGTTAYTYDALNRLAGVTSASITGTYTLDGDGNRLAETFNGQAKSFTLDLRDLPTILEAGGRKYLDGMPAYGYEEGGTWTSSLIDQTGSVLRTVAADGTVSAAIRFDPYGGLRPGSASIDGIGYTGEWTDPSGLVNLRARAYAPALARFLSADTWGGDATQPLTGNAYAYGLDNPLAYTDPTGHLGNAINFCLNNPGFIISLIPVIGQIYSIACAVTGTDLATGQQLSSGERLMYAMGALGALGKLGTALAKVGGKFLAAAGKCLGAGMRALGAAARGLGRAFGAAARALGRGVRALGREVAAEARGLRGESRALGEAERAEAAAATGSPTQLVDGRAFEAQQLEELGVSKFKGPAWQPSREMMDSAAFHVIVGEPRFTPGGQAVGVIPDSIGLEIKGGTSPLRTSYQLRLMTYRSHILQEPLTIRTTRPVARSFSGWLGRWGVSVQVP